MTRKKILFATDYSARDRKAFRAACRMAEAWDAALLVVHVADQQSDLAGTSPGLDPNRDLMRLNPDNVEIQVEHLLRHGNPAEEIMKIEQDRNVVLIVLGTRGRTGLERVLFGSVAEQVLREANCPVMTFRGSNQGMAEQNPLTRVLLPVDFSVHGYVALDFAAAMTRSLNGELTILHVDESLSDSRNHPNADRSLDQESVAWQRLTKFRPKNQGTRFHHKLMAGSAALQIPWYANSKHYDYVVLGTHGRTGINRALMGSVAEQVVRRAKCPVITVKPSNKRVPVPGL